MRTRNTALLVGLAVSLGSIPLLAPPTVQARGKAPGKDARARQGQPAWLGTALAPLTKVDRRQKGVPRFGGVLVQRVVKHSPADRTGFQAGDVIMRIENKYVYKPDDIIRRVAASPVGKRLKIDIIRNGGWMTALVKLTPRPGSVPAVPPRARPVPPTRPAPPAPRAHPQAPARAPGAVVVRLQALEREVRRLREAILGMKRRCRR